MPEMSSVLDLPRRPIPSGGLSGVSLKEVFFTHRLRILFTYGLFLVENLLRLAQPFVIGLAINDLMAASYRGLGLFLGQHLLHLIVGTFRQMYDTRVFTGIYTELAGRLVREQRRREVPTSSIVARAALSREFVDFFERHIPIILQALFSVLGALFFLAWYDWSLVPMCLGLLVPACILNHYYGGRILRLSRELHDQFEREVSIVDRGQEDQVREHYSALARTRVRLSDSEAINFGLMELFVMGLIAFALLQYCFAAQMPPGDVFAVFRYLLLFVMGLDNVPVIVAQVSKLRDIGRRLTDTAPV